MATEGLTTSQPGPTIPASGSAGARRSYFLSRLTLVVLALLVPLVGLQVLTLLRERKAAEANAFASVTARAGDVAVLVEGTFARAEQLLTLLASREELRTLNVGSCRALLKGIDLVDPVYANVLLVSVSGKPVCSTVNGPTPGSFADAAWFKAALTAKGFALSDPLLGRITNRQLALLSLPVVSPAGERLGLLVASIDLNNLAQALPTRNLPDKAVVAIVRGNEYILTRAPDSEAWIGRPIPATVKERRAASPNGIVVAESADGIDRAFASVQLSRYKLRTTAGVPVAPLYAAATQEGGRNLLGVVLAGLLGLAVAVYGSRKLATPLASIADTTRRLAAGERDLRADESLPGEFGELAVEFNRLLDEQAASAADLLRSKDRTQRLSNFYEALSRTNQAIAQLPEPVALFDDVCRICVETKLASMSWIGLVEDDVMRPVAWGGRGRDYTNELTLRMHVGPGEQEGPSAQAVRLGKAVTVNRYLEDPKTMPWRQRAGLFGIKASAAFPFTSGDVVAGALNLYSAEEDYFDSELVELLDVMMRDISLAIEAHQRELARTAAEDALRVREVQVSGIIETVADAIVTVDSSQRVVVFNKAAGELFAVDPARALGQSITSYLPKGLLFPGAAGANAETPLNTAAHIEGVRADGTACTLKAFLSRHQVDGASLTTAVLHDETKLKEADRARAAMLEAEAANRAKTTFLSQVSHELRTPLNAVLGFTTLLLQDARSSLDERNRQRLDNVHLAGTQLRALVEDVLDMSKVGAGQLTLEYSTVELQGLLDEVVKMSESLAERTGVTLMRRFAPEPLVRLRADPVRLRQVLLNLVSNAIKYNKPGGQVVLAFEQSAEWLRVQVNDTGLGMSQEQLDRLFQPFNRLGRERSSVEGHGIGLSLSNELVRLFGGRLDVRSEESVGTQVVVTLPRKEGDVVELERPTGSLPHEAGTDQSSKGVVLYIEDNPVNALLMRQVLSYLPEVTLVGAATGAEGVASAADLQPDLVLLDMQLPDMTGLEVLRRLRSSTATRGLRVVALSASATRHEVDAARQAGVEDYWTKPIDIAKTLAGINRMLGESEPAVRA